MLLSHFCWITRRSCFVRVFILRATNFNYMLFLFNIISKSRSFVLFSCQIKKNSSKCLAREGNFLACLDEDILMIKVRTERDKSPKKWSLEFDLTKIKMFPGEDKRWRLVSRCWSFIVKSHGVIYWDDRQIRDPIWEGNFEFELIFLQLWSNFSLYFRRPPRFKLLQTTLSLLLLLSH